MPKTWPITDDMHAVSYLIVDSYKSRLRLSAVDWSRLLTVLLFCILVRSPEDVHVSPTRRRQSIETMRRWIPRESMDERYGCVMLKEN